MDVFKAVNSRIACRHFLDQHVDPDIVRRLVEGAANAASSGNLKPWNVYAVTGEPLKEIKRQAVANARLYAFWGALTEALRTGEPQNEAKQGRDLFDEIYREPAILSEFLKAMTGLSLGAAHAMAEKFPWADYKSFADIGTAEGGLAVELARAHPHLNGIGFDLPVVGPHFDAYAAQHGLSARLSFHAGDFFTQAMPPADVLIMGHVLHDWSLEKKRTLIRKAYEALPFGGALIVYDPIIDDDRRRNSFGLLMSLNMLIETREGFDFTGAECADWLKEAGFAEIRVEPLVGPDSMVIGLK